MKKSTKYHELKEPPESIRLNSVRDPNGTSPLNISKF